MNTEESIKKLHEAIIELDKAGAKEMAQELVNSDVDLNEVISTGMVSAMDEIGKKFQEGTLFLPELQLSGMVFQAAMDIILPKITASGQTVESKGRIVFGTVKGDIHNIGKDLTVSILKTAGFEVFDLGVDVPTLTILEEAQNKQADIIALSALMSTTMPMQREVIEALNARGLRDKFKVVIGGAPVNQEWADKIGADGYAENAAQAVDLAKRLCAS